MKISVHRIAAVFATLSILALSPGCSTNGEVTGTPYKLPDAVSQLSADSQDTLRAVFTIDGVVGPVTMDVDAATATASGQYVLPNEAVQDAAIHIELYGALSKDTEEVLLGSTAGTITIEPGQYNAANLPPMSTTGELYDANRNGRSNLEDLKEQIDPAPMANPLDISPDTISFDSGVEVGGFTRSFFVIENNGEENVSMDMSVQLAPGITISPLEAIFELGSASPEDTFQLSLAPDEEQVMAVTFAPSDALFLAGALSINSLTETSNISHGLNMRLIGNPEGAVPQPPSNYGIPNPTGVALDGYTGSFQAYGINQLFSREPFTPESMTEQDSGTIAGQDIDDAYLVVVPRGYRFSLTMDGLTNDVDLFLFDATASIEANGSLSAISVNDYMPQADAERCSPDLTLNTVDCSTNVGQSSESISYDGTQQTEANRYLIVGLDVREVPTLDAGAEADTQDTSDDTTAQPLTGEPLQGAGMQAAMYNRPDIEFIQSNRPCPNNKYGLSACSKAEGNTRITIHGVNFESPMSATITWRDIATGNEVAATAFCSDSLVKGAEVPRPVQDPDTGIISNEVMILDSISCLTPEAVVNPQVGPKANVVLTHPNGAVAVKPEAIVYLPPEPEVDRVFPAAGPTTGGTTITVYGKNFYELNGRQPLVALGNYPVDTIGAEGQPTDSDADNTFVVATVLSVSEDGQEITIELPTCDGCEAVTPHALTVVNPDLQFIQEGSLFTYVKPAGPGPELLGVEPASGSVEGSAIHLYGTNFFDTEQQPITTVLIDNREVTEFSVYPAGAPECPEAIGSEYDCIALTAPAHNPGAVPVEVSNAEDQTSRLPNGYTYEYPNPSLDLAYPDTGSTAGGLPINIAGAFFQPGIRVFFGELESPIVTFISVTSVTAVTPAGANPGTTSIRVEHVDGTSTTAVDLFTFVEPAPAPIISGISPASGFTTGGQTVIVEGSNFQNGASVFFNNTSAPSVNFVSSSQLEVITPSRANPETVSIRVENPDFNSVTLANAFTYTIAPPVITAIDPGFAPVETNTTVFITGTGFQTGATVSFGDTPAASTTVNSATLILASTPSIADATSVNVTITNPDAQSVTYPGFTFDEGLQPPPRIISLNPTWAPPTGGTVTISGQGLDFGTSVFFGDTQVFPEDYTTDPNTGDLQLRVFAPSHPEGDVIVRVQNFDGQADAATFTYEQPQGLAVTAVVPGRGDFDLVTPALVVGNGFTSDAVVTIQIDEGATKNPLDDCKDLDEEDFEYGINCDPTQLIPTLISDSVLSVNLPPSCVSLIDSCYNLDTLSITVSVSQNGETSSLDNGFIYETTTPGDPAGGSVSIVDAGQNCQNGGIAILSGDELPIYICDGADGTDGREITVIPTPILVGSAPCEAAGGTSISIGYFEDTTFIELNDYTVCNGEDGANGADGANGTDGADGAAGLDGNSPMIVTQSAESCEGTEFLIGFDTNGSGELEPGEITEEVEICNGTDGSDGANGSNGNDGADGIRTMATMSSLGVGDTNCPYGGTKITIWVDTDGNSIPDLDESPIVNYACNGYGWDFDPNNAPTVSHAFPSSLFADLGGLVGITGTNFSPTDTRVVVSGQTLVPVAAQSSSTYLVVDFPEAPQQEASTLETGDTWGNFSVNFEVVNINGQSASGSIRYETASCWDRGQSFCPDHYACENYGENMADTACVWNCDGDGNLEYPEQCISTQAGWSTACGGSTLCSAKPGRAGSPITIFYPTFTLISFGGEDDTGLKDDMWQGRQPPGHSFNANFDPGFIWEEICTSTNCINSKPSARAHHGMSITDATNQAYMFGGVLADGSYSDELWKVEYNAGEWNWTLVCGGNSGCTGPSGRERAIFYGTSEGFLLIGGRNATGALDDTWTFNAQTGSWTDISCAQNCASQPVGRFGAKITTGGSDSTTMMFMAGGETSSGLSDEIWYSPVPNPGFQNVQAGPASIFWTLLCGGSNPCSGLPPLKEGIFGMRSITQPEAVKSLIYHGGEDASGAISDKTFELPLTITVEITEIGNLTTITPASDWTQICGAGTACSGEAVAESVGDYIGSEVFVFGGKYATGIKDDVVRFTFDGTKNNGQTCSQFGYAAGSLGCSSSCGIDTSTCIPRPGTCGNGTVEPWFGEECEPSPGFSAPCSYGGLSGAGIVTCGNNCQLDYSACSQPYQCGTGELDHPEKTCDQSVNRFSTCTDFWNHVGDGQRTSGSESSASLSCLDSCQADTSDCQVKPCGNGDIDIAIKDNMVLYSEACDPGSDAVAANLAGLSCTDFGKIGTLACYAASSSTSCEFDLSGCSEPESHCSNGVVDGGESDLDCGGDNCLPCSNGLTCTRNADCLSGLCDENDLGALVCIEASFSDGEKNGQETDVDCGGPQSGQGNTNKCLVSQACVVDSDCGPCQDETCTSLYESPNGSSLAPVLCKEQRCVLTQGVLGCSYSNGVDNCFIKNSCECNRCGGSPC